MATLSKKSSGGNIKSKVNNNSEYIKNFTKVKALFYLLILQVSYDAEPSFTYRRTMASASDIAKWSDNNVKSLRVLLARWRAASWGYVDAGYFPPECCHNGRGHWLYRLNAKGKQYVERVDAWYPRATEAKEAVINSGLLVHDETTGEDLFKGFPKEVLAPIVWQPEGSLLDVTLSYPFTYKADIKPFPTEDYINLLAPKGKHIKITGDYGICAHSAKEAFELIRQLYKRESSAAFQKLVADEARSCIAHSKHQIAEHYGLKVV